ncbi:MAG TPA: DNA translocase FtsK [Paenisporosarcina sp.]|nr:DNA translocase FtsK [Paenisporosarcina sp.]
MINRIHDIDEAIELITQTVQVGKQVSVSMIQRKFRIGYSTARRTLDKLVELGYVESKEDRIVSYYRKK